jgi:hypothetical protein
MTCLKEEDETSEEKRANNVVRELAKRFSTKKKASKIQREFSSSEIMQRNG